MKHVPYEKMSKKQRRALDRQKRGCWNGTAPVTRRVESAKAYSRKGRRAADFLKLAEVSPMDL